MSIKNLHNQLILIQPKDRLVYGKWKQSRSVMSNSLQPRGLYPPGSSIHGIF